MYFSLIFKYSLVEKPIIYIKRMCFFLVIFDFIFYLNQIKIITINFLCLARNWPTDRQLNNYACFADNAPTSADKE